VDAKNSRITKYNNLRPGHYRFEVKASNNDGVWNETGQSVELNLEPHVWQTWWFFNASALLAAGVVAGTARFVTHRRMQKKLARLELQHAVEEERKRIARDVHDELGSRLTWISFQGGIAKCRPDDPVETMKQIDQRSESAREAVTSLHEIIWAADPENDSLDGLIGHISHFTGQFFCTTSINCEVVAPEHIPVRHLPAVVRHNAAKHANATRVLIQIFLRANELEILISDNGSGFYVNGVGDSANPKPKRTGYGLTNMRTRLESIEGRCEINSEVGQGTSIRLVITIKEAFV
jgi:signal transduction histidine kinase